MINAFMIAIIGLSVMTLVFAIIILIKTKKYSRNIVSSIHEMFSDSFAGMLKNFGEEFFKNREELSNNFYQSRKENSDTLQNFQESLLRRLNESLEIQGRQYENMSKQLNQLVQQNEQKMEKISTIVSENLEKLQKDNSEKLEKMRLTVDEKLHKTLEDRLGSTFKIVSERLELVHKGLGEMQQLASGIGDLKKVLTNVKTRGVMGEIQLGNILEEMFSPEQYSQNVKVNPNRNNFVEFALKLPGQDGREVWIPIDAKFPIEDYQELLNFNGTNPDDFVLLQKTFARKILSFAKDIRDKYITPPYTTNFAIMFLPVEGVYAEVLKNSDLFEKLRKEYSVVPTGPTTLAAFLSSLQMGFRTLAIEKRSSEVWELLGAVKTEFRNFGEVLDKTKKKLQEASNVIDKAEVRTRAIERKLKDVEALPEMDSGRLLED
ncbi:MAG: DNA recombination protein RmuC [Candidatus Marinimicrobia bacterium]|nr:DNA recombination protein RmuC [Candidatus Neomarinimicrobiota bacterium]